MFAESGAFIFGPARNDIPTVGTVATSVNGVPVFVLTITTDRLPTRPLEPHLVTDGIASANRPSAPRRERPRHQARARHRASKRSRPACATSSSSISPDALGRWRAPIR